MIIDKLFLMRDASILIYIVLFPLFNRTHTHTPTHHAKYINLMKDKFLYRALGISNFVLQIIANCVPSRLG